MRKNIVAGNWKMNKTLQEGIAVQIRNLVHIQVRYQPLWLLLPVPSM